MVSTLFLAALLTIPIPAKPANYVTDHAGVLPADKAQLLEQKLKVFEQQTSDQVLVYIDKKVPDGTTLEEMGAQAIRGWGVGQAKQDNGVILFVFTDDRKMRIEVGYGLEGSLTDAKSKLITSTIMKPRLQSGDFPGAVEHGVDAILNTIGGESYKGSGHTVAEANAAATSTIPVFVFFLGFLAFVIILSVVKRRSPRFGTGMAYASSSDGSSSSDWSSSDSSSSSDFDSGGGDGGGGGASDSW
jgi:uncharacterized protein